MNKAAYDVLVHVRDEVLTNERFWVKGEGEAMCDGELQRCLWSATLAARRNLNVTHQAQRDAERLLVKAIPWWRRHFLGLAGVVTFNDHPKTTFADVRKVLAKAIRLAEAA